MFFVVYKMTEFVTPHLRTVLKTFQDTATKSLHGPGLSFGQHHHQMVSELIKKEDQSHQPQHHQHHHQQQQSSNSDNGDEEDDECDDDDAEMERECGAAITSAHIPPHTSASSSALVIQVPPAPELPQPILTEADTGCATLYETILEGRRIGCFILGGEMRLCLPQVLNNVLMDFTLEQINCTCERLQIFCSQCTPEQLAEFKAAKILPEDVKTSGLITRTNAERLCSALLYRGISSPEACRQLPGRIHKHAITFRVYHRCFGQADGFCTPDLFSIKEPACIECVVCRAWFSPQKFIFHGHGPQEEQTCHWGFDSGNWRAYVHVSEREQPDCRDKFTRLLDEMKERECRETVQWIHEQREIRLKRKVSWEVGIAESAMNLDQLLNLVEVVLLIVPH